MARKPTTKPRDVDEFRKWMARELQADVAASAGYYQAVAEEAVRFISRSAFWQTLIRALEEIASRYEIETNYKLLLRDQDGSIATLRQKPFASMVDKAYRFNVVRNAEWPDPPAGGWVTPDNWLSRFSDTVRTTVLVRYLDGIDLVRGAIQSHCDARSIPVEGSLEARIEGYYALHMTCSPLVEVRGVDWQTITLPWTIEIQVATQVQDIIRQLTHTHYEERRSLPPRAAAEWQWDYRSPEFAVNYLGHILHYMEGTILNIRDSPRRGA